ncbi:MAG: Rrf2 family transcriptional regulator [Anaerolineae bacterium]|nr:Rrf2 family transcriptional regulator [Anaerolineae bacterium]
MVRLTKGADYGARGTIHLAKQPAGAVVLISEIAAAEALPESYLAKIFQDLAKEGIVRSHRGARGGFSLARPPDEITLREVVEAIDGPIAISRCLAPWEGCDKIATCSLYPVMQEAQRLLLGAFEATTLSELALREGLVTA